MSQALRNWARSAELAKIRETRKATEGRTRSDPEVLKIYPDTVMRETTMILNFIVYNPEFSLGGSYLFRSCSCTSVLERGPGPRPPAAFTDRRQGPLKPGSERVPREALPGALTTPGSEGNTYIPGNRNNSLLMLIAV